MIFTRDFVTRENHWQITPLVTKKSLFTVTHALFFISCIHLPSSVALRCWTLWNYYSWGRVFNAENPLGHWQLVPPASLQYIRRNMHTVFALLCFVVVIHWLIFPYPSGLLHWHCGNLTIAPVPAKQPWWIWIDTSCEFIMNDCITTTKQSTTQPCANLLGYFMGYTVLKQALGGWSGTLSNELCPWHYSGNLPVKEW